MLFTKIMKDIKKKLIKYGTLASLTYLSPYVGGMAIGCTLKSIKETKIIPTLLLSTIVVGTHTSALIYRNNTFPDDRVIEQTEEFKATYMERMNPLNAFFPLIKLEPSKNLRIEYNDNTICIYSLNRRDSYPIISQIEGKLPEYRHTKRRLLEEKIRCYQTIDNINLE